MSSVHVDPVDSKMSRRWPFSAILLLVYALLLVLLSAAPATIKAISQAASLGPRDSVGNLLSRFCYDLAFFRSAALYVTVVLGLLTSLAAWIVPRTVPHQMRRRGTIKVAGILAMVLWLATLLLDIAYTDGKNYSVSLGQAVINMKWGPEPYPSSCFRFTDYRRSPGEVRWGLSGSWHWNYHYFDRLPSEFRRRMLPSRLDIASFHSLSIPFWPLPAPIIAWAIVLWLHDHRRRIPPGHCQRCGYNLTANVSGICPECGDPCQPDERAT